MMEPNVCFFPIKMDFATINTELSRRRFWYTISSILEQKTFQCISFAETWSSNWVRILPHRYQKIKKIYWRLFCRKSAGIKTLISKIAAANLNSQQEFYDNGASGFLRKLTAVSVELLAILEEKRRVSKKNPIQESLFMLREV